MPGGSCGNDLPMAAIASPELTPGAACPDLDAGTPL
jgi:hypothetical protein